jgi:hypothetical protein
VPDVAPDLANFSWHLADHRYQWHELQPAVEELKAVPFRRFQHNFLRGLMVDPEAYAAPDQLDGRPRFNAFVHVHEHEGVVAAAESQPPGLLHREPAWRRSESARPCTSRSPGDSVASFSA